MMTQLLMIGMRFHGHYGAGMGHGLGHVFSTIAHAAIWSLVGRLIWHAPIAAALVAAGLAGLYLIMRGRRG